MRLPDRQVRHFSNLNCKRNFKYKFKFCGSGVACFFSFERPQRPRRRAGARRVPMRPASQGATFGIV